MQEFLDTFKDVSSQLKVPTSVTKRRIDRIVRCNEKYKDSPDNWDNPSWDWVQYGREELDDLYIYVLRGLYTKPYNKTLVVVLLKEIEHLRDLYETLESTRSKP